MMIKINKIKAGKYEVFKDEKSVAVIEKLSNNCWRLFDSFSKEDFKTLTEAKNYAERFSI